MRGLRTCFVDYREGEKCFVRISSIGSVDSQFVAYYFLTDEVKIQLNMSDSGMDDRIISEVSGTNYHTKGLVE